MDNKCPVTCQKCPEHVLGVGSPVTSLQFGSSSFSSHQYPELDEAALKAIQETLIESEKEATNSGDKHTDEVPHLDLSSSTTATQQQTHSSSTDTEDNAAESMTVEIIADGSISTRTCADLHESCSGRATHGDCEVYPK